MEKQSVIEKHLLSLSKGGGAGHCVLQGESVCSPHFVTPEDSTSPH